MKERPLATHPNNLLGQRDLKIAEQVVGQDTQPLPGAVGAIVVSGHCVEREAARQFGQRFLLGATPGHEEPQVAWRKDLVRCDIYLNKEEAGNWFRHVGPAAEAGRPWHYRKETE